MRILITGASGLLAGRLLKYLIENTTHVIRFASRTQLAETIKSSRIEYTILNWESERSMKDNCSGVDVIFHLAGLNAKSCEEDPARAYSFNTIITLKFFEIAQSENVGKFIYFSSGQVYGSNLIGQVNELIRLDPKNYYAASKSAAETALLLRQKKSDTSLFIIRLANSFGAPITLTSDCWSLFVNSLVKGGVITNELKIGSDVNVYKNFVPIHDVVSFCSKLLEVSTSHCEVLNFGSEKSVTLLEMAELIKESFKLDFGIDTKILVKDDFLYDPSDYFTFDLKNMKNLILNLDRTDPRNEIRELIAFSKTYFDNVN
jgi:UDP-glucose 4-epimerase